MSRVKCQIHVHTLDNMAMVTFFAFVQKLNSSNLTNLRLLIKDNAHSMWGHLNLTSRIMLWWSF